MLFVEKIGVEIGRGVVTTGRTGEVLECGPGAESKKPHVRDMWRE